MRQYRIKQTDDNKYYAQTRQLAMVVRFMDLDWYSITNELKEVEDYEYSENWGDPLPTMEQAQERIDKFKAKTQYPKYYSSK